VSSLRSFLIWALLVAPLLLAARAEAEPARGPFLWEVEGPRGPVHLFGTIHMGVSLRELNPVVTERLDASSTVVGEADPSEAFSADMLALAVLPAEESLESMLGAEHWKLLVEFVGGQIPEPLLTRYRPWFAVSLMLARGQEVTATPLDLELLDRAEQLGKKLEYLEEITYQAKLLDQAITAENLSELLGGQEELLEQLAASLESYRAGDHESFEELMLRERAKPANRKQFELLFDRRNREWLPVIERYLQRGHVFIAVGAGHLLTEGGLVAQLRARGHVVKRIVPQRGAAATGQP
jgi:uncharacterized protein YbaP (TraB family)